MRLEKFAKWLFTNDETHQECVDFCQKRKIQVVKVIRHHSHTVPKLNITWKTISQKGEWKVLRFPELKWTEKGVKYRNWTKVLSKDKHIIYFNMCLRECETKLLWPWYNFFSDPKHLIKNNWRGQCMSGKRE